LLTVAPRKSELLPGLPTVAEVGLPATLDSTFTGGVIAPKRTPTETVDRIHRALVDAVASSEMLQQIKSGGRSPMPPLTQEEYGQVIRHEIATFTQMAAAVHYTPE
jgi:tripartite-type tricarboxylate transporter receptor subunit TctC